MTKTPMAIGNAKKLYPVVLTIGLVTLGLNVCMAPPSAGQTQSEPELTTAIEKVAASVGPAVVAIQSDRTEHIQGINPFPGSPFEDDLLNRFFSDFFDELPDREFKKTSLGSGVIIDPQGYILTNEHVVRDTDKITVTLPDGREFQGSVKGTDPRSDLAVVKIDASNLPSAKLGDSDILKTGQWVVAIGNPFGIFLPNTEPAVTAGVISALHRSLPGNPIKVDTDYTDLIQTDAAINPGNSGGPLVNLHGEIIGINVAIFSISGGYQGIGFAIPSNTAQRIVGHLIEGTAVEYGWIGVGVQDVNARLADFFDLKSKEGVVVTKVIDDSPAQTAGIKDGDIIVSYEEKPIKNTVMLIKMIGNTSIGKTAKVEVWRDKGTKIFQVKVAKRPGFDSREQVIPEKKQVPETSQKDFLNWRGATIRNIPPDVRSKIAAPDAEGVIIVSVENNSPAQEAGLRKGDMIVSFNKNPVKDINGLNVQIKKVKGDCLVRTIRGFFVVKEQ